MCDICASLSLSLFVCLSRELALESGVEKWGRVPALNTNARFIEDLADAVVSSRGGERGGGQAGRRGRQHERQLGRLYNSFQC